MQGQAEARSIGTDMLAGDMSRAMAILGMSKVYQADFPNIRMSTIPHLELLQFAESCILDHYDDTFPPVTMPLDLNPILNRYGERIKAMEFGKAEEV